MYISDLAFRVCTGSFFSVFLIGLGLINFTSGEPHLLLKIAILILSFSFFIAGNILWLQSVRYASSVGWRGKTTMLLVFYIFGAMIYAVGKNRS